MIRGALYPRMKGKGASTIGKNLFATSGTTAWASENGAVKGIKDNLKSNKNTFQLDERESALYTEEVSKRRSLETMRIFRSKIAPEIN